MIINGLIKQNVTIDPIVVIEKLIESEAGYECWVFDKDGKYYVGWEESAGQHSFDQKKEISKERYDQVVRLEEVIKYLKNKE